MGPERRSPCTASPVSRSQPAGGCGSPLTIWATDRLVAAKSALAFVPDEPQPSQHPTVEEHLRFVARLYRVEDVGVRFLGVLRELELGDPRDSLPEDSPGGMKQKLAIACALIHVPTRPPAR